MTTINRKISIYVTPEQYTQIEKYATNNGQKTISRIVREWTIETMKSKGILPVFTVCSRCEKPFEIKMGKCPHCNYVDINELECE